MECWRDGVMVGTLALLRYCATPLLQNLGLRNRGSAPLFHAFFARGCSSVVEHLLAKEDVASSSLVTRSPSRGER